MLVIGREVLEGYLEMHADLRSVGDAWLAEVQAVDWKTPAEMKERYPHASVLPQDRVVFDLKGNRYRALVQINFEHQIALILKVGTHQEYDRWQL